MPIYITEEGVRESEGDRQRKIERKKVSEGDRQKARDRERKIENEREINCTVIKARTEK